MKTIGILGLGLIGGSFAKAYRAACGENGKEQYTVYGCDTDRTIEKLAVLADDIRAPLTPENLAECDLVLLAVPPTAAVSYLRENAALCEHYHRRGCCGVKGKRLPRGVRTGKEKRLHLPRRTSYGGDPSFGLQSRKGRPFQGCAHGAGSSHV